MSGETPQHEGQDFVAHDESQRVISPEKARAMADYSNEFRSKEAAYNKQQAQREKGTTPLGEFYNDMGAMAKEKGEAADFAEQFAGEQFEGEKLAEIVGTPTYESIRDFEARGASAARDQETFERYLVEVQADPTKTAEQQALSKLVAQSKERTNIFGATLNKLVHKRMELDSAKGLVFQAEYEKFKSEN